MPASKIFKIVVIVVVALVFIGAGVWIGLAVDGGSSGAATAVSPYSAVYLSSGDIYFGKLGWFPSPHLDDPWYLQRTTDANGNTEVNVYPFNKVVWGPSDTLYFNSQQILFWTRLASDSSVVQIMENPNALVPPTPSTGVEPQSAPQATTTASSTLSNAIPASVTSTAHTK